MQNKCSKPMNCVSADIVTGSGKGRYATKEQTSTAKDFDVGGANPKLLEQIRLFPRFQQKKNKKTCKTCILH